MGLSSRREATIGGRSLSPQLVLDETGAAYPGGPRWISALRQAFAAGYAEGHRDASGRPPLPTLRKTVVDPASLPWLTEDEDPYP